MNNISIICFLTAPSLLVFGLMLCVGWWFLAFFHLIFACMPCYLVVHICSWRTYVIVFKWSSWHLSWLFGRSAIHRFVTTKDVFALQTWSWGSARCSTRLSLQMLRASNKKSSLIPTSHLNKKKCYIIFFL